MPEPGGGEFPQSPPTEKSTPYVAGRPGRNFYTILGVKRGDPEEVVKRNYRQLARQYHPDHNPGDPEAAEHFKDVSEAWDVLSDPNKSWDYEKGYGRYELIDHPDRPYVPPPPPTYGYQRPDSFSQQTSAPTGEPSGTADSGQDDQAGSAGFTEHQSDPEPKPGSEPWSKSFDSEYDNFDFPDERIDKVSTVGRTRTQRPRRSASREKEQTTQNRITQAAEKRRKGVQESAWSKYQSGKWTYEQYLAEWRKANNVFDKRFFQEAKSGVMSVLGEATATVASSLETAILDRLVQDKHFSVEPKIYVLPDGTYIRVSWTDWNRDTTQEESITKIEHVTGERDERGYFHTEGIEVVREGQKPGNTFWLRRITRPYNLNRDYLDFNQIFASLQFYFDNGFGGPYRTVATKGAVRNKELKEYMTMLQQATPREQPVGV